MILLNKNKSFYLLVVNGECLHKGVPSSVFIINICMTITGTKNITFVMDFV